jgi:hypothetical protein
VGGSVGKEKWIILLHIIIIIINYACGGHLNCVAHLRALLVLHCNGEFTSYRGDLCVRTMNW